MEAILLGLIPLLPSLTEEGFAFFQYLATAFKGGRTDPTPEEQAIAKQHADAATAELDDDLDSIKSRDKLAGQ